MKILILNSGSSSIKFQVIEMPKEQLICIGLVERIGFDDAILTCTVNGEKQQQILPIKNHKVGLQKVQELLLQKDLQIIEDLNEIGVVGHRVVHGGSTFSNTTIITEEVRAQIKKVSPLAPLHNPHNLEGIEVATQVFPNAKQVAVFDTAFHQSIPEKAYRYAIPKGISDENGLRLYGFHGTSHKYVSQKAMAYLENPNAKLISIHLGNGCSITAVNAGKSLDHSLGFAPSNGLIMGTRSGDIDHGIIFYLVNSLGYALDEVNNLLNKESGMMGLTGKSDLRDIEKAAANGDKNCQLALDMSAYRIKKYIGAYAAVLNGVDALIFTGGIGENSSTLRAMICKDLSYLGVHCNAQKNTQWSQGAIYSSGEPQEINEEDSPVKILVVPTNEELEIARQSYTIIS